MEEQWQFILTRYILNRLVANLMATMLAKMAELYIYTANQFTQTHKGVNL